MWQFALAVAVWAFREGGLAAAFLARYRPTLIMLEAGKDHTNATIACADRLLSAAGYWRHPNLADVAPIPRPPLHTQIPRHIQRKSRLRPHVTQCANAREIDKTMHLGKTLVPLCRQHC